MAALRFCKAMKLQFIRSEQEQPKKYAVTQNQRLCFSACNVPPLQRNLDFLSAVSGVLRPSTSASLIKDG